MARHRHRHEDVHGTTFRTWCERLELGEQMNGERVKLGWFDCNFALRLSCVGVVVRRWYDMATLLDPRDNLTVLYGCGCERGWLVVEMTYTYIK